MTLDRFAGQTAAAWIYAGRQDSREVVLKVLRPELETPQRRRAWAALASRPTVPGTPPTRGGGAVVGEPAYLVYEAATGEGLDRILSRPALSDDERESLLFDLMSVLAAAHRAGQVHLDLRPSKVRRGGQGLFLLDLGHLAALGSEAPLRDLLDPRYTAPEQAAGGVGDVLTDVYQLALLAHKVLFGRLPFTAPRAEEFWNLHLEGEPDLSAAEGLTRTVLAQALSRDPTERFPDAESFQRALFGEA